MERVQAWRTGASGWAAAAALALLAACSNQPPSILKIPDTSVNVNSTVSFDVAATDVDSDKLTFTMQGAPKGAQLAQIEGKLAKFSWTPNPAQVGVFTITFVADDGNAKDTESVNLKVVGGGAPELLSPDRYVVDLSASASIKFVLELRDDDDTQLDYAFDPDPTTWGADVKADGKKVYFSWEPTDEQKTVAQHAFLLRARDDDGNVLESTITIIFRGVANDSCPPGKVLPAVTTEAIANQTGDDDYAVTAHAHDADSAIQYAVAFFSTVAEPKDGDWGHANLTAGSGDVWRGAIPNLNLNPGESVQVTWHVCAADDDDPNGDRCDGWTCSEDKTFNASSGLGLCDPCQTGQCAAGICLQNSKGETFCGEDCGAGGACPTGFYCENIALDNGQSRRQCIPNGCKNGSSDPTCSCAAGRPVAPVVGDLVLNEILFDPPDACPDGQTTCDATAKLALDINGDGVRKKDESDEEFVEIVNRSDKYLQMQGVTVADSDKVRFTFPVFVLPPKRAVLVFGGGDATKFGPLGGAFKYASAGSPGGTQLQLNNSGDTVTLALGQTQLDQATWTSTAAKGVSLQRQKDGDKTTAFGSHATAPSASGAKWSPGTHICGSPFPLDPEACVTPSCAITNRDSEPQSDARSTAPCLKPLPQTVQSTLAANQLNASSNDVRDLYAIEGRAGTWLHAHTEGGSAPEIGDTVLKLIARNGSQVEVNDDDPWNAASFYSRLIVQFPSDGLYFLEVSPLLYDPSPKTGSYKLIVETSSTQPQNPHP